MSQPPVRPRCSPRRDSLVGAVALTSSPEPAARMARHDPGAVLPVLEGRLRRTGEVRPNNPACSAAVPRAGRTRSTTGSACCAGRRWSHHRFIPDGKLCSGGNTGFSGYDAARTDWPLTHLTAGSRLDFKYSNWAHPPGTFYF